MRSAAVAVMVGLLLACGGLGGASPCERACQHIAACGASGYETCVADCPKASPEDLAAAPTLTCAQVRKYFETGGIGGGDGGGAQCMQSGVDDCPGTTMCCAREGGRAAKRGEAGMCLQVGLCNLPR